MVEQGRSPTPENRKPIQQWEVKAIPDAVEAWYAQGADSSRPKQKQPVSSPAPALPSVREEHENRSPVKRSEAPQLLEAAEQAMRGGTSDEAQEKKLEDTIRALRIEEKILKFNAEIYADEAVNAAEKLRDDPLGFGLINSSVRLHPTDAEQMAGGDAAFSFHDRLVTYVHEAMQEGRQFTREDLLAMYGRHQRREDEFREHSEKYEAYSIKHGFGSFDFTMENLLAASERKILAGHLSLSREENKPLEMIQPARVAAHEMIESCLPSHMARVTS